MSLCIVALSDTHELHGDLVVPDGDVLVHAGDFTGRGSLPAVAKFAAWMAQHPHKHKIVIAGNHEMSFEDIYNTASPRYVDGKRRIPTGRSTTRSLALSMLTDAGLTYLEDSPTVVDGRLFYGSPWTPAFKNWAFNLDRGSRGMLLTRAKIPADVEVLITHGPPFGILDSTVDHAHQGCQALAARVFHLDKLKANIFGHLHKDGGKTQEIHVGDRHVQFVNAAICDDAYAPIHSIQVVEV